MKKTILEIYALAVCFFTVACFAITLGLILWNIVEYLQPEFAIDTHAYGCHQSDFAYKDCYENSFIYAEAENPERFPTGAALTAKRQHSYANLVTARGREARQGIVKESIIIVIDILVFAFHWRVAKRAREAEG